MLVGFRGRPNISNVLFASLETEILNVKTLQGDETMRERERGGREGERGRERGREREREEVFVNYWVIKIVSVKKTDK